MRQAVLAEYLRKGLVQLTPLQATSGSGLSQSTLPTLAVSTTPLPTAVPVTPLPTAPPSLPPSACGSTPLDVSATVPLGPLAEDRDFGAGGGRPVVRQPALGGQPVLGGARSIIGQLVQLGVPVTALGTSVVWFDHKPEADRRSAALQPARRTIPELQAALLHRELRRHRRITVKPCTFTAQKLATSLRYGNGQKRLFASTRGKLHVDLMKWRYELASRDGSLTSAMGTMISVFTAAVRMVIALSTIEEEVDTLAHHGVATDDVFFKMLRVAEYELLPSGDSDDSVLLQVEWHPTNTGVHTVRNAFNLLTKLRALAVSNQQGGNDELILRYFRVHLEKARALSNLVRDPMRRSLPDMIHNAYLTTEQRATYCTVARLAKALKEPSSIGTSSLLFTSLDDSHA